MAAHIANHNDVTAFGLLEVVDPSIEKVMIGIMQSRQHARTNDLHGGDKIMANDKVTSSRHGHDAEALEDLLEEPRFVRHPHHLWFSGASIDDAHGAGCYSGV